MKLIPFAAVAKFVDKDNLCSIADVRYVDQLREALRQHGMA